MRLLLTGPPASGKTTLALKLSRLLDCPLVQVNDFVEQLGCYAKNKHGEKEVDLKIMQRHLKKLLEKFKNKKIVVEGHLLADMKLPCEKVLVLRANPRLLLQRMKKRGYRNYKIAENLYAEILDYFALHAEQNYGEKKVVEIDFSKPVSAKKLVSLAKKGKGDFVDWTPLLLRGEVSVFLRKTEFQGLQAA